MPGGDPLDEDRQRELVGYNSRLKLSLMALV
jgi:hypothetical protein